MKLACATCQGNAYDSQGNACPFCLGLGFVDDGTPGVVETVENPFGGPTVEQEATLAGAEWKESDGQ